MEFHFTLENHCVLKYSVFCNMDFLFLSMLAHMWFICIIFLLFSALSDLIFDVFKEVIAELITETVGSYLGLGSTRRTGEVNSSASGGWAGGLMDLILHAVRKHSLKKKRGCI